MWKPDSFGLADNPPAMRLSSVALLHYFLLDRPGMRA
jgi:hypothetical protein